MKSLLNKSKWVAVAGAVLIGLGILRTSILPNANDTAESRLPTLPVPGSHTGLEQSHQLLPDSVAQDQGGVNPDTRLPAGITPVQDKTTQANQIPQMFTPVPQPGSKSLEQTPTPVNVKTISSASVIIRPDRIVIEKIRLDAPVVKARLITVRVNGFLVEQWVAPNQYAAGWHSSSAGLGSVGNTVLNGHHNAFGEVFRRLSELALGDRISIYSGQLAFIYTVTNKLILPELGISLERRLQNARWIAESSDERLTLVTCWPYSSNTHRLVIAARPDK